MRRLFIAAAISLTLLFAFASCRHVGKGVKGSGVRKTEKRDLGAFKSIQTTGAYDIQVTCQQAASFEIEADDNILPLIRTSVRDGMLNISSDTGYSSSKAVIVRISVPDLEAVATHGAGDIRITDVKNDQLTVNSTGAARIEAVGQTNTVNIQTTGAGKIDTSRLRAERAKVTVTGAGSVDVYASQQLDATVSGIGKVVYDGNPGVVNKSVSGIGTISKKERGSE
ncbi:MAG TPA: head GIN domain-containing protein [Pyrinomonadaceae bacterium]|nr:head GIN domain-containing protein [Pyrinomonadaceae bacterium]